MPDHLRYLLNRLRERLWIKPVLACLLSVAGVLLAHLTDQMDVDYDIPQVTQESVIALLKIISAGMLAVATFAVASMVSAYASAGQVATARAFPLIVADDVSQNALSTYIGAFIFSIVALSAAMNGYYGRAGSFTLFVMMAVVMAVVVLTFVRWVDRIARLGRIGAILAKVERAAGDALERRRRHPRMGGTAPGDGTGGTAFHASSTGYVQRIDIDMLQRAARKQDTHVMVEVLPGAFVHPGRCLGRVTAAPGAAPPDTAPFAKAFMVGPQRQFDDDPRFGLLVLSEIACRALSQGINDAGTAIAVLGSLQRVLIEADAVAPEASAPADRVAVPLLPVDELFDDAFNAIARDAAGTVEVGLRLQRLLGDIGRLSPVMRAAAQRHAALALARAEAALAFEPDLALVRARHAEYWPATHRGGAADAPESSRA